MLYNFSTKGNAGMLVDEQAVAGDPAAGMGGNPNTVFSPGWVNAGLYYPAMIVIDLGKLYNLSALWLYDVNDCDSILVYTGDPSNWQFREGMLLNTYNTWRSIQIQTTTRFLRFTYKSPQTRIAEVVLYGTEAGTATPPPSPAPHPRPFMDHFIGVNGFVDDPVAKLKCAGSLREYHNWGWDEGNNDTTYPGYPNNQYAWNPSWVSGPGWGFYFDDFYQQLKTDTLTVSPDLQGTAPYLTGFTDSLTQYKPISPGESALDPMSYLEHSDYMFQFAARYGTTAVSPSMLKLRPDQSPVSGSNLAGYLENWNEPDKWWKTRKGYFTPDELSAMCSADYDGHENSMGPGKGMKNADPAIRMVMGGLATLNIEYIRCMKLWSDFNRQSGFPADVLNFHHYSGNGSHGISPEADSLKSKLQALVHFRDSLMPGKDIWLSEFGYDTNPLSQQSAVAIDTNDIYEVQGQWILRSYLEASAAGVDKAFVFMLRDVNAGDPNVYNSSGLTNEKWNGHQPKKSWYYVSAMNHQLQRLRFEQEIPSGQNTVSVYKFQSVTGDTAVYAVWCRTSSNTIKEGFTLDIGTHTTARLVRPQFGMPEGSGTTLSIGANTVTFRVTERPVFVRTTTGASPVPEQAEVSNWIVTPGTHDCFNARQRITVAGNGTTFLVQPGGHATFISGGTIQFFPGTTVEQGGELQGWITATGQYCPISTCISMLPDKGVPIISSLSHLSVP